MDFRGLREYWLRICSLLSRFCVLRDASFDEFIPYRPSRERFHLRVNRASRRPENSPNLDLFGVPTKSWVVMLPDPSNDVRGMTREYEKVWLQLLRERSRSKTVWYRGPGCGPSSNVASTTLGTGGLPERTTTPAVSGTTTKVSDAKIPEESACCAPTIPGNAPTAVRHDTPSAAPWRRRAFANPP